MSYNPTILDVARLAGVSKSTASRALANSDLISATTKMKVLNAAKQINYHPNAIAKSLSNAKTNNVGIVIPSQHEGDDFYSNHFFQNALRGASLVANQYGYDIVLSAGNNDEFEVIERLVNQKKVDGLILMRTYRNESSLKKLVKTKIPFVVIGSPDLSGGFLKVDTDNRAAMYDLSTFLLDRCDGRLGYITADITLKATELRLMGYRMALEAKGMAYDEALVAISRNHVQWDSVLRQLTEVTKQCSAVIASDTQTFIYLLDYCKAHQIKIPDNLKIASFNNSALAEHYYVPITAIDVAENSLGHVACELLIKHINGEDIPQSLIVPHAIIQRASTL